jgi:hypothetical protein
MLSGALQRNAKPRKHVISATQRMAYTRRSMRPGFQTSLAISAKSIDPKLIRDGKPGLAPKAFGAALQLRFAQNDIMTCLV